MLAPRRHVHLRAMSGQAARTAFVASPEGIILAKLQWYREGGTTSEQQWTDVVGMLKILGDNDNVDRAYVREWGQTLGVADLVARALDEAGVSADSAPDRREE